MVIVKEVFIVCHVVAAFTLFFIASTDIPLISSVVAVVVGALSFILAFYVEDVEV